MFDPHNIHRLSIRRHKLRKLPQRFNLTQPKGPMTFDLEWSCPMARSLFQLVSQRVVKLQPAVSLDRHLLGNPMQLNHQWPVHRLINLLRFSQVTHSLHQHLQQTIR